MAEVVIDRATVARVISLATGTMAVGESYRQLLGLRLLRTLADLAVLQVRDRAALASVEPLSNDPLSDIRFGWPSPHLPELVEVSWPAPNLPREPLEQPELHLSPWALHSLMLGDWGALVPGTALRLPKCIALLLCDGLTENPAGRDLLRVTGQLEVLSLPTRLHSQIIVCGLADGVGLMEVEIQVIGPDDSEVGFAVKRLSCPSKEIATFYVANLDDLEVHEAGHYWFILRMLGQEVSRLPIEVATAGTFERQGGFEFGQAWTWEGEVFFGERD